MRFNFVYFVLLAESTKFISIRKPYTYTSVSNTALAVRKFLAYENQQTLEYEIFTRMKISAITVFECELPLWPDQSNGALIQDQTHTDRIHTYPGKS